MSEGRGRLAKATPAPFLGLAGPVAPVPTPVPERVAAAYEAAGVDVPEPEPEPAQPAEERKQKIGGWNGYPSNLERIRRAWYWTQTHPEGWPSMSEMTEQVLLNEAARLEQVANAGQEFPPVPEGKVKRGRKPTS